MYVLYFVFVVYIWKTSLKLDVCAFIISFRRFSNAKSTAENTYRDRVGSFCVFKYNIMYGHRRRQPLKLHMFFKIKFVLYKKKNIVVDGCARGKLFHTMADRARSLTSLTTGLGTSIMYIRRVATCTQITQLRTHCHSRDFLICNLLSLLTR